MSPIVSTLAAASAKGYGGLGASVVTASGAFESIATYTAASNQSSIVFDNIPTNYQHLQVRAITRASVSGISALGYALVNNNTTTGDYFFYHLVTGDQSGVINQYVDASSQAGLGFILHTIGNTGASDYFSPSVIDFIDSNNTNKFKNMKNQVGFVGGSGQECQVRMVSSTFKSTAAITKLEFIIAGSNFMTNSQIALYGIKGAS